MYIHLYIYIYVYVSARILLFVTVKWGERDPRELDRRGLELRGIPNCTSFQYIFPQWEGESRPNVTTRNPLLIAPSYNFFSSHLHLLASNLRQWKRSASETRVLIGQAAPLLRAPATLSTRPKFPFGAVLQLAVSSVIRFATAWLIARKSITSGGKTSHFYACETISIGFFSLCLFLFSFYFLFWSLCTVVFLFCFGLFPVYVFYYYYHYSHSVSGSFHLHLISSSLHSFPTFFWLIPLPPLIRSILALFPTSSFSSILPISLCVHLNPIPPFPLNPLQSLSFPSELTAKQNWRHLIHLSEILSVFYAFLLWLDFLT